MEQKIPFEKLKDSCKAALSAPETLYSADCVNYVGRIPKRFEEGGEFYTEYLARFLNQNQLIGKITENKNPEAPYTPHTFPRNSFSESVARKREENIAFNLFDRHTVNGTPLFLDYQYPVFLQSEKENPLYDESLNGQGKVDLIYRPGKVTYLTELKSDTCTETLLRAVMEIDTYYQRINKDRFCQLFGCSKEEIHKAVMVFEGTKPHEELLQMQAGERPQLAELASDISFFVLTSDMPASAHPKDASYQIAACSPEPEAAAAPAVVTEAPKAAAPAIEEPEVLELAVDAAACRHTEERVFESYQKQVNGKFRKYKNKRAWLMGGRMAQVGVCQIDEKPFCVIAYQPLKKQKRVVSLEKVWNFKSGEAKDAVRETIAALLKLPEQGTVVLLPMPDCPDCLAAEVELLIAKHEASVHGC